MLIVASMHPRFFSYAVCLCHILLAFAAFLLSRLRAWRSWKVTLCRLSPLLPLSVGWSKSMIVVMSLVAWSGQRLML